MSPAMKSVTPVVKMKRINASGITQYDVTDGQVPSRRNSTPSAIDAQATLTIDPRMSEIGNTSRGAYTLLRSALPTRLVPPLDTELEKNVHGSSPT